MRDSIIIVVLILVLMEYENTDGSFEMQAISSLVLILVLMEYENTYTLTRSSSGRILEQMF